VWWLRCGVRRDAVKAAAAKGHSRRDMNMTTRALPTSPLPSQVPPPRIRFCVLRRLFLCEVRAQGAGGGDARRAAAAAAQTPDAAAGALSAGRRGAAGAGTGRDGSGPQLAGPSVFRGRCGSLRMGGGMRGRGLHRYCAALHAPTSCLHSASSCSPPPAPRTAFDTRNLCGAGLHILKCGGVPCSALVPPLLTCPCPCSLSSHLDLAPHSHACALADAVQHPHWRLGRRRARAAVPRNRSAAGPSPPPDQPRGVLPGAPPSHPTPSPPPPPPPPPPPTPSPHPFTARSPPPARLVCACWRSHCATH
jgi:hypothetical protein